MCMFAAYNCVKTGPERRLQWEERTRNVSKFMKISTLSGTWALDNQVIIRNVCKFDENLNAEW